MSQSSTPQSQNHGPAPESLVMKVLCNRMTIIRDSEDLYLVRSSSGNEYIVELESKTCSCPGFQYRDWCSHLVGVLLEEEYDVSTLPLLEDWEFIHSDGGLSDRGVSYGREASKSDSWTTLSEKLG